jgi:hypothetical protein
MKHEKLITALRTAATALSEGTFYYHWHKAESCNCGIVACALLGTSAAELRKRLQAIEAPANGTWTDLAGTVCPMTGVPTADVFAQLYEAGLTVRDFKNLEYLTDPRVLARLAPPVPEPPSEPKHAWFDAFFRARRAVHSDTAPSRTVELDEEDEDDVALYLRAWADLLEAEDTAQDPAHVEAPAASL